MSVEELSTTPHPVVGSVGDPIVVVFYLGKHVDGLDYRRWSRQFYGLNTMENLRHSIDGCIFVVYSVVYNIEYPLV